MKIDSQGNVPKEEKTIIKKKRKHTVRTGNSFELKLGCTKRGCKFGLVARRKSKAIAIYDLQKSISRIKKEIERIKQEERAG
jgi:hypothetical protein